MPRTPVTLTKATMLISMLGLSAEDVDLILSDADVRQRVMQAAKPNLYKGIPHRIDKRGKLNFLMALLAPKEAPITAFQKSVIELYTTDNVLRLHLGELTPPQQEVIIRFYGLRAGEEPQNLVAIAKEMGGISRSRVRILREEGLGKLRVILQKQYSQRHRAENEQAVDRVDTLGFSTRTHNLLRKNGILTVADFTKWTRDQLGNITNFGFSSLAEIDALVESGRITLAG